MVHRDHLFGVVLVFEHDSEDHGHHEGIAGEDIPRIGPSPGIDDGTGGIRTEERKKPLVIIMKTPCAEERISRLVSFSTNSEPEILKKSNATP